MVTGVRPFSSCSAPRPRRADDDDDDDVEVLSDAPTSLTMCPALQGPFLDGRLLLWLFSSWHAGGGGGSDDDDDTVRSGCRTDYEEETTCANSQWAVLKVALPFLFTPTSLQPPDQRAHTTHDTGQGLEEQCCHSAAQQPREAPVHQQGLLAMLTHCPLLGGSQGICMPGQVLLLMRLQDHFPLRMLAVHSKRVLIRSLLARATSCLMTLCCALARMHMASACLRRLQRVTPHGRGPTR